MGDHEELPLALFDSFSVVFDKAISVARLWHFERKGNGKPVFSKKFPDFRMDDSDPVLLLRMGDVSSHAERTFQNTGEKKDLFKRIRAVAKQVWCWSQNHCLRRTGVG